MRNILVLYRELAGYIVNCLEFLAEQENLHIDIVAYPIAAEAPFQFLFSDRITVHRRSDVNDQKLTSMVSSGEYELIFCGGWFDKGYLNALKSKGNTPSVIGFDKQWKGTIKDRLAVIYLRLNVTSLFDYAFVPGSEQVTFAKKMGFNQKQIKTGVYVCDNPRFSKVYEKRNSSAELRKNRVIYAGRYIPQKDILNLMSVAEELANQRNDDWEFHFIGAGSLWEQRINHPKIIHHGFLEGKMLDELLTTGSIFILPSLFEPWGVVVHEFAMAGYPLILSDQVGARTSLLTKENGIIFPAGNLAEMKKALNTMMNLPYAELTKFGHKSHLLAKEINEKGFANSMAEMMNK
jgi:glycosyltransferase involved in cell wall biosynthesis